MQDIKYKQLNDLMMIRLRDKVIKGKATGFVVHDDGVLRLRNHQYVPKEDIFGIENFEGGRCYALLNSSGTCKTYKYLKHNLWGNNLK